MSAASPFDFNIAIAVLTIMILIGGIALGLGYATNNKNFKEFGKDELYQSAINGAIIGGLIALFMPSGIITSLISSITLSSASAQCPSYLSYNSAICFSYSYLVGNGYTLNGVQHSSILSQSTLLIMSLLSLNAILGIISSIKISLVIVSFSPSAVVAPILNQIQFFIKALTTASLSAFVQSSILSAIAVSSISILLPLGIILRTFFPTRKLGGFIIATVVGLYVVFPLTYLLNAQIVNSYSAGISNSTIVNMTNQAKSLNNYLYKASSLSNGNNSIISTITNLLTSISDGFSSLTNQIVEYISYFIMAAFILPAFSIILTSISVKELSGILGSEINFNIFDSV